MPFNSIRKMEQTNILSGFKPLDKVLGGFQFGSLITLAGRPCMRTEFFTYSMVRNWLKEEEPNIIANGFVYFSLKDKKSKVEERCFGHASDALSNSEIYVIESYNSGLDIKSLCEKIIAYSYKGTKVFIIDNFNMIEDNTFRDTRIANHNIARRLLKLSHEMDIIIILDAMLYSYYIEEREGVDGKRPCLGDLGYEGMSGDLDVFSDVVIGFWSPEKYHIYQDERGRDLHHLLSLEILKNVNDDNSEGERITLYIDPTTSKIY